MFVIGIFYFINWLKEKKDVPLVYLIAEEGHFYQG